MRKFILLIILSITIVANASNRYRVHYSYVDNGAYTTWKDHTMCSAVGWTNEQGKLCVNFYWYNQNVACFRMVITDMDLYSMKRKEYKKRKKENKPFIGTGVVTYCTFSGRYDLKQFPGGDAFPFTEGTPKGQWVTSQARFEYSQHDEYEQITVAFENYQFSVILTQPTYGTYY